MRCPCCGCKLDVEVDVSSADGEKGRAYSAIVAFAAGLKPDKGYVKKLAEYEYEFYLQVFDSPEGDRWIEGKAYWNPPNEFKLLECKVTYR